MDRTFYFLLALSLTGIVSCRQKEIAPAVYHNDEIVLYASNLDLPQGKTQLQDNGAVRWVPGDAINVFYQGESSKCTAQCTTPSVSTQFKGKLDGYSPDAQNSLWAVYPLCSRWRCT